MSYIRDKYEELKEKYDELMSNDAPIELPCDVSFCYLRDTMRRLSECGIEFFIADELDYYLDAYGKEYTDEVYEYLCNVAYDAYMDSADMLVESICRAVARLYEKHENYKEITTQEVLKEACWL